MSEKQFLPFARQLIHASDAEEVAKTLLNDIITRGPKVAEFEQTIASYCGSSYAVAFNSGTSALSATYFAAGANPHDKVISSPNTFIGTLVGCIQAGSTPVFVDIDRTTGNIDLPTLELNLNQIRSRGREILMVMHYGGIPVDMKKLDRMIRLPETIIIEDAAHALGSRYPSGEKVGSCHWSHMTVFSFHPNKHITTGEGGMVTTNDENLYQRLLLFRNNGVVREAGAKPWYYEVREITGNFNFTDFQAALGLAQLKRLDQFQAHRIKLMQTYRRLLGHQEKIRLPDPQCDAYTNYHLCTVQIDFEHFKTSREKVMNTLLEEEIGTQLQYIPLYRHPYLSDKMGDVREYFPNTEQFYSEALALPFHCAMDEKDVERVVLTLKKILN